VIWLALNLWWILPACLLVAALLPIAFGHGIPVVRAIAKRVPVIVWQVLGLIVLLSYSADYLIGVGEKRCQAAQEAAEARADTKAIGVTKEADKKAQEARDGIRKESSDAQSEARTIVRYLEPSCPTQPARLRELGGAAVQGARGEVLPTEGR
jgi:hypothetical protein